MAILITGTPGVGKTTIASLLAEKTGKRHIDLARVVRENKLYTEYDKETGAYVVNVEKTRRYLSKILTCEEIIDTHVVEAVPSHIVKVAIVLRLDPLILKERLEARGYPVRKVMENVEAEILDYVLVSAVDNFGEDKVYEIDTTGKDANKVIEDIMKIIGKKCINFRPGKVDWLTKYYFLIERKGGII